MTGLASLQMAENSLPICADCHQAHDVTALAYADRLQGVCLGCHEGAQAAHNKWLPNSKLIIVKEAAHLVILDHANEFNNFVREFLE